MRERGSCLCVLEKAFVDLEKSFDRVPRKVIEWWALRKKGMNGGIGEGDDALV